jgi:hypothetical protein
VSFDLAFAPKGKTVLVQREESLGVDPQGVLTKGPANRGLSRRGSSEELFCGSNLPERLLFPVCVILITPFHLLAFSTSWYY